MLWEKLALCLVRDGRVCLFIMFITDTQSGTGPKLQSAIRNIVDYSVTHINRRIAERTASAASAAIASEAQQTTPQQQSYAGQDYYAPSHHYSTYPGQTHDASSQYQQPPIPYDTSAYNAEGMRHNIEAQLNAELSHANSAQHTHHHASIPDHSQQQTPTNFAMAFQAPATPHSQAYAPQAFPQAGPAAWRHFADNMMTNLSAPEQYAATANMAGGISTAPTDTSGLSGAAMPQMAATFGGMQMPSDPSQAWPAIVNYGVGPQSHGD